MPASLRALRNLGANDIYYWYLANSGEVAVAVAAAAEDHHEFADLKANLIWPCTDKHVKKYSKQGLRFVTETPDIYRDHVRPFVRAQREAGRLNWAFNIIEGRSEADDVIYRTPYGRDPDEGFLLLPDLNWDRRTVEALHLLGLVERRDLWSLRDLRKKHVPWLRHMKARFVDATTRVYPAVDADQLKLYFHYQPTYYHLHVRQFSPRGCLVFAPQTASLLPTPPPEPPKRKRAADNLDRCTSSTWRSRPARPRPRARRSGSRASSRSSRPCRATARRAWTLLRYATRWARPATCGPTCLGPSRTVQPLDGNDQVVDGGARRAFLPLAVVADAVDVVVEPDRAALGHAGLSDVSIDRLPP